MALSKSEQTYITEKFVNWQPGRIRYWESLPIANPDDPGSAQRAEESKAKPAILMLHGYGAMLDHWRRTFAGLKGRYRLYAMDLLGFGGSAKPNGREVKYSAGLWAKQVADFLKFKGETSAIIMGHSMGGMVSIQFELDHPEMVAGLILVDSAGLPDQGRAEQEARSANANPDTRRRINFGELTYTLIKTPFVGETMATVLTSPNEWTVRRFLQGSYYNKSKVTPQLVEQFLTPLRDPGAAGSYLAITRSFSDFQLKFKPGDVKGPVLFIWGEYDRQMPPANMLPLWKRLIPQAETYTVTDAGHCPMDERPDLVNPRIMQFVEQVAANSWQPATNQS